jgi:hypothetical protein
MAKPIPYPTEGGSYVRKSNGSLDQVEATKPADAVKSIELPDPPPAAAATEKE